MTLPILRQPDTPADFPAPARSHPGDAGLDLRACLPVGREVVVLAPAAIVDPEQPGALNTYPVGPYGLRLWPGGRAAIPVGWGVAIPDGHEGQIRPRSGLALRTGYRVHPGTVGSGYCGELRVIVIAGPGGLRIRHGDRIAQLVVSPVSLCDVEEVEALPASARAAAGFGPTGTR